MNARILLHTRQTTYNYIHHGISMLTDLLKTEVFMLEKNLLILEIFQADKPPSESF
jgi:hypothetical protein